MKSLSVEAIEAAQDLPVRPVHVPEWAGKDDDPAECYVFVRGLTARERDEFERENVSLRKLNQADDSGVAMLANMRARLVSKCLCKGPEDRTPLFGDFRKGNAVIATKSGAVVDRLFDVASDLNGMSEAAVEEAAGNSEASSPSA